MTVIERVQNAAGSLKVFPLPSAVLFPGAMLPLHIFENRYRAMVSDALASDRVMALAGLLPGWEADYLGRPPMRPICCVGVIAWHEEVEDGRFNILVQGVTRARIITERSVNEPYRVTLAKVLEDPTYLGDEQESVRNAVLELSTQLPETMAQALVSQVSRASGGELADLVASVVVPDADRRRELLENLDPRSRLQAVLSDVSELIARTRAVRPLGPLN